MPEGPSCPRCGSPDVIPRALVEQYGDSAAVQARVQGKRREEWKDRVNVAVPLYARVCGNCGHAELYVERPDDLLRAYSQIGN
jgi:predicted nucleic-acid-binding Zn-ribbon protein